MWGLTRGPDLFLPGADWGAGRICLFALLPLRLLPALVILGRGVARWAGAGPRAGRPEAGPVLPKVNHPILNETLEEVQHGFDVNNIIFSPGQNVYHPDRQTHTLK